MEPIKYCFGIGYRCVTDVFMDDLKIRKYSGPFSYIVCDLETSLEFIEDEFKDFTNVQMKPFPNHGFGWNNRWWCHTLFFNKKYLPPADTININTVMKRICCWNHHDLNDPKVIETIQRRQKRFLDVLASNEKTLLIYIDNVHKYTSDIYESYFNKQCVLDFLTKRPNVNICIMLPLLDFSKDPIIYNLTEQLTIIIYKTNLERDTNDYNQPNIPWDKVRTLFSNKYTFSLCELK